MAGLLDDWINQQQPIGGGLLNVDDMKRAQQAGLFGGLGRVAEALMAMGAPSRTPGGGIGSAFAAFPGGYAQSQGDSMNAAMKQKIGGQQFQQNEMALQDSRDKRAAIAELASFTGGAPQPNGEMVQPAGITPNGMLDVAALRQNPKFMNAYARAYGAPAAIEFASKKPEYTKVAEGETILGPDMKPAFQAPAKKDETQRLFEMAGIDPNSPEGQQLARAIIERKGQAPQTNVRVDVKGPVAGAESAWKGVAEQWTTMRDTVARANKREANFQNYETAMQSFDPGIDANVRMKAAQAFNAIGLKTNAPQAELMLKIQRENELANTPKGQGQITENERVLIRDANNIFGSTPDGARLVIAATRQADNYDRKVFEIMTTSAKQNGGAPNPVEVSQAIANLGPVLDPNLEAQLRATAGQGGGGQTGQWSIKKK